MKYALLLAVIGMFTTGAIRSQTSYTIKPPAGKNFRFIYNCDGANTYCDMRPPLTPEKLYPYVDEVANAGFTTFMMSPNVAMPLNYPTKVGDMYGDSLSPELEARIKPDAKPQSAELIILNLRSMVAAGQDPFGVMIDRAKEKKMEVFISYRLNEVHSVEQADDPAFSRFWKQHPEWRIGKNADPSAKVYSDITGTYTNPLVKGWMPAGLNYAIPEVRAYQMAILREMCENYNVDGLELDFQRFPMYFKPGEETNNIPVMTQWIKDVRKMVNEVAARKKTKILFNCRVLAKPEQNIAIGLDPASWAREKLIDFIVVAHFLHNEFPLPISAYKKLMPKDFPVYGSIEVAYNMSLYRQIAGHLWEEGVNGIYLYNFFTRREKGLQPPYDLIHQIATPAELKAVNSSDSMNRPYDPILLAGNKQDGSLSFINPKTLKIIQSIPAITTPQEIIITPDQKFAYLSSNGTPGKAVSVIDLTNRKLLKKINTGKHNHLYGGAMAPDGKHAYFTTDQPGYVLEIDTKTNSVSRTLETHGDSSQNLLISPEGNKIYTTNTGSSNVSVIEIATGKLITQIPCGKGCGALSFTPNGKSVWVTNASDETITIINDSSSQVEETFTCSGVLKNIRFTSDGKRALITSNAKSGELLVMDVEKRKEYRRIPTGSYASALEISPDGKRAFVSCTGAQEINVIDLEKFAVLYVIKAGAGAGPVAMWFPPNKKFTSLFNGRDLNGWNIHGTEKWYVKDGELVCENGPDREYGYLSTEKKYKNFVLDLNFLQVMNGNSGVFIRSGIEGVKISGWQVEVAPAGLHTGGIYESYGRGWLIKPAAEDEKNLKVEQWNNMRIEVMNDTVTTWLNGKKMVHLVDEKIGRGNGFIALQIHNGADIKVRWKDIMIREL